MPGKLKGWSHRFVTMDKSNAVSKPWFQVSKLAYMDSKNVPSVKKKIYFIWFSPLEKYQFKELHCNSNQNYILTQLLDCIIMVTFQCFENNLKVNTMTW